MDLVDILSEVLDRDASDLHLTTGSPPIVRLNGELYALDAPKLTPAQTRELIYSVLTQEQRQRLENEWDIDFSYSLPGRARFRVNAYFQRNSIGAAFRTIPVTIKRLDELGLPPSALMRIRRVGTQRMGSQASDRARYFQALGWDRARRQAGGVT